MKPKFTRKHLLTSNLILLRQSCSISSSQNLPHRQSFSLSYLDLLKIPPLIINEHTPTINRRGYTKMAAQDQPLPVPSNEDKSK